MRRLQSLVNLSWLEVRLLAAALPLVLIVRLGLWLLPSSAILAGVRRLAAMHPRSARRTEDVRTIVWAVRAVSRRFPAATCLTQAIAARVLLVRHGLAAELRVGVARDAVGEFRAHAWLEREGRVIIGGDESLSFKPMPGIGMAELIGVNPNRR